jgi:glycosyltransferase involved in cell wall biosynthesis
MKILVISQYYFPEQFRITDICETLVSEGHDVTVLTGLPNYPTGVIPDEYKNRNDTEIINGVNVIRARLIPRGKSSIQLMINYLSFAFFSTIKIIRISNNYDVVLANQLSPITSVIPAITWKIKARKKMLLYCLDLWPESISSMGIKSNSLLYYMILFLSRFIYRQADHVAISSMSFEKYLVDKIGLGKNVISYLPQYAEEFFSRLNNSVSSVSDDSVDLLFAGNIGEMQDVETILLAANELKNIEHLHWHIVGDGNAKVRCESLCQTLNLSNRVTFHGHYPLAEMANFYKMASAFLITLKTNDIISSTLPGKMQTYLAAGKPILAAIDGETKRVIEDAKCGLVAPAGEYKTFAANVKRFIEEKEMIQIYGNNAKSYYIKYFSKKSFINELETRLGALLKG